MAHQQGIVLIGTLSSFSSKQYHNTCDSFREQAAKRENLNGEIFVSEIARTTTRIG